MIFHWHINSDSCERTGQHTHRPVSQHHGESILPRGQRPPFQAPRGTTHRDDLHPRFRHAGKPSRGTSFIAQNLTEKAVWTERGRVTAWGASISFFFFFNPSETLCQIRPQFRNFMYNNTTLGVVWVVEQNICWKICPSYNPLRDFLTVVPFCNPFWRQTVLSRNLLLEEQIGILGSNSRIQAKYFWKKCYSCNFQFVSII